MSLSGILGGAGGLGVKSINGYGNSNKLGAGLTSGLSFGSLF